MTSHYDILGISRTASDDEVKSAYIKKAKIFHPDVMKNNNLNNVSDSDMEFKKINEAYNWSNRGKIIDILIMLVVFLRLRH